MYRAVYRSEEMVGTTHLKGYVEELLEMPGVVASSAFSFVKENKEFRKLDLFLSLGETVGQRLLICVRQKEMVP
jgi:hypothetical protein